MLIYWIRLCQDWPKTLSYLCRIHSIEAWSKELLLILHFFDLEVPESYLWIFIIKKIKASYCNIMLFDWNKFYVAHHSSRPKTKIKLSSYNSFFNYLKIDPTHLNSLGVDSVKSKPPHVKKFTTNRK